jgi:hypothetical protein
LLYPWYHAEVCRNLCAGPFIEKEKGRLSKLQGPPQPDNLSEAGPVTTSLRRAL